MRLTLPPRCPPTVQLHRCRLDDDSNIRLDEAVETLAVPEVARSARFIHRRDVERYVRGRGFVRRTLGAHLGLRPCQVELLTRTGGKPCVAGGSPDFNLTHSGDWAVLAVSSTGSVGIDLELRSGPPRNWEDLLGIGRLCFTPDEMDVLAGLCGAARIARFLSFWTAKEARMKLSGHGMRMDPRTIVLRLAAGEPFGFLAPGPEVTLHEVQPAIPGAVCHLALSGADPGPATTEPDRGAGRGYA